MTRKLSVLAVVLGIAIACTSLVLGVMTLGFETDDIASLMSNGDNWLSNTESTGNTFDQVIGNTVWR